METFSREMQWLDATAQADLFHRKEATAVELLNAAVDRIEDLDPRINAVVYRWFDDAAETAARIDRGDSAAAGPFAGVPFLLKDLNTSCSGRPLSNGNARLRERPVIGVADTTLVRRFRRAGLVIAGRTNTPELGSIGTTEPVAWGPTRNPWDRSRTAGGSSGGAAAAVAAGMVPIAHASDGGGSIRIPASCCGLVGLKPSHGRVTRHPSQDESGLGVEFCVTRSIRDTAVLLDSVSGPGVGDSVIAPVPARPYLEELECQLRSLRIGLLDHHPLVAEGLTIDMECVDAVHTAARLLEELGHRIEPSFPNALADPRAGRTFSTLWSANVAAGIARLGEHLGRPVTPDDVEPLNWAHAQAAGSASAADHALAQDEAMKFRRAVRGWWADGFDILLSPTLGKVPSRLGALDCHSAEDLAAYRRRTSEYLAFTPSFNVSGQPAISLPLSWTESGLPVGIQLVADYGREDLLIALAGQLERAQPWENRRPLL
ncbi:amidase [Amycolatopsis sp. NPDC004079]|uniref:amidase n=1 Tax=Amycolatopsis sp. NPDC004079 TaxID=3154549 RepID=UPI0033A6AD11